MTDSLVSCEVMVKNHVYGVGHSALQKCLPCCRLRASKLENDVLFLNMSS